ncbi:assimilatory sulfite reductase (NADPH) hemoprotein subunit [Photobacterium phosphoreum]|mgnify:CR=1 FL=1|jgi:sulfite reductase (NADPH) hemoprotein beta-component|uniref:assimilatory sulfite reductase (NADPH) hemoprotein subunit n=1 Tax=Photobacterium phosphoreum TaxID=659 RepID=UPI0005D3122B|nr:assimilatory sulfite reductase (NADPH) hemoprotein subunit [Photobacterium phosphoreum]KJF85650.1 sulfite reductase subunit beta [Photobacterium phosphoreum]MCD9476950.1 assimilatory sulfite reductase (NADPH) hemoprotein subunit [Photobacterium phosphoreum]MCD9481272.1 assimilatory sulfite reductase (NADPH) hemoprotein subunit [Photobacterium phosphoreum]MCD9485224.1 assimilatory sulfite reductase (NADPH) hemoprotein subunit [Photobacterium phosphoreum]MCD9504419.1 assimilatory sulfite redu
MTEQKLSDNERLKRQSNFLRGTIEQDLDDRITGGFSADNFQLIRFHGMYQQDDRDIRAERAKQKLEPLQNVMLRARMPGGVITPKQWLAIDKFADEHTSYGSIRLTTRQTFQFHGVLKPDIKLMHQTLNKIGIDSIATAGDVNRNVLCTTNPVESELHQQAYEWAKKISEHLLPKTRAYAEIWLDGEKLETTDEEPILGSNYLPRKFKTTVVIPPQNDVDVHANDLNFIAIADNGKLVGFNVLVGGGLAMTHGDHATYPRRADDFGFVPLDKTLDVATAVVTTQRDWGNRSNRKNAKTKYTLDRVGVEVFKAEVEQRAGIKFADSRPYEFTDRGDRIGWVEGIDGKHHLALFIENGRLLDYPNKSLKTGMAAIAKVHGGDFRMTANQNLIVAGVLAKDKARIEKIARDHGLMDDSVSEQRKNSMACVSLPTCPLAMAEAERFLPEFVTDVEGVLEKHGLDDDENIILRVTGCPNGCGRAMLAEIGLVGKAPGRYNLHLGGNRNGTRVPKMYRENITVAQIMDEIDNLVGRWAIERQRSEDFGDFTIRAGIIDEVKISMRDFYA